MAKKKDEGAAATPSGKQGGCQACSQRSDNLQPHKGSDGKTLLLCENCHQGANK